MTSTLLPLFCDHVQCPHVCTYLCEWGYILTLITFGMSVSQTRQLFKWKLNPAKKEGNTENHWQLSNNFFSPSCSFCFQNPWSNVSAIEGLLLTLTNINKTKLRGLPQHFRGCWRSGDDWRLPWGSPGEWGKIEVHSCLWLWVLWIGVESPSQRICPVHVYHWMSLITTTLRIKPSSQWILNVPLTKKNRGKKNRFKTVEMPDYRE